jgi:hypothetical protein
MPRFKRFSKLDVSALYNSPGQSKEITVEWYCTVLAENLRFITNAVTLIATEHDCDLIAVRADVHNTQSVRSPAPQGGRQRPVSVRVGATSFDPRNQKANVMFNRGSAVQKTYEPAPWHITAEFRRASNAKWFNVHIYTETQEIAMGREIVGVATGYARVDGKEIRINPEIFEDQKHPSHGRLLRNTTFAYLPLDQIGKPALLLT